MNAILNLESFYEYWAIILVVIPYLAFILFKLIKNKSVFGYFKSKYFDFLSLFYVILLCSFFTYKISNYGFSNSLIYWIIDVILVLILFLSLIKIKKIIFKQ